MCTPFCTWHESGRLVTFGPVAKTHNAGARPDAYPDFFAHDPEGLMLLDIELKRALTPELVVMGAKLR